MGGRNRCTDFERVGGWLEDEGMGVIFEGVGGQRSEGKEWV